MQDQPEESSNTQPPTNAWRNFACEIRDGATNDKYVYCTEEEEFYIYKDNIWQQICELDIIGRITESSMGPRVNKYPFSVINQILDFLRVIVRKPLSNFNSTGNLNLLNGVIKPWEGVLRPHKAQDLETIRQNYKFEPDAKCELWIRTLNGILENDIDKLNTLQEFFGYCLTRSVHLEKALLLIGKSRSGKSTILNTLQFLVGEDNCSHIALKYLNNNVYTAEMVNKLINIDSEVSRTAKEFEQEFNIIVTGHEVKANSKYTKPFKFRPFCKMVMAANVFPSIKDHSSAFYNRLIIIPCNRVFEPKEQNRHLREELLEELPGILNWSLEGLARLNKRGMFEEKDYMKDAVEELKEENNPSDVFFKDHIEVVQGEELEKPYLYIRYKEWCSRTNNYPLSDDRFGRCMNLKYSKYTLKDSRSTTTGKRVWRNLKYVEDKEAPKPEAVDWRDT